MANRIVRCPPNCAQAEGLVLGESVALLAQLTAGFSAGQLQAVASQLAERLRQAADIGAASSSQAPAALQAPVAAHQLLAPPAAAISHAALELLPAIVPVSKEAARELADWSARVHMPLPPEVGGWVGCELWWVGCEVWRAALGGSNCHFPDSPSNGTPISCTSAANLLHICLHRCRRNLRRRVPTRSEGRADGPALARPCERLEAGAWRVAVARLVTGCTRGCQPGLII